MRRTKLLFVGAFREDASIGAVGGTVTACRQLLDSPFRMRVAPVLIDSTAPNPPHPIAIRAGFAALRMVKLLNALVFLRPDCALIFATGGLSWIEKGTMALVCRVFRVPVVLAPRSMSVPDAAAESVWFRRFTKTVLRSCAVVMVQSGRARARFVQAIPEAAAVIRVKANWIDAGPYCDIAAPRTDGKVRVLYLGWLAAVKGIDVLVEAVSRHRERLEGVTFVVCGGGEMEPEVRRRVRDAGLEDRFRFDGWISGDAKRRALEECELLVLPSRSEGMPNAVLEAMASGRAVIGTDVGGVADLIGPPERGRLIPPEDPDTLAAAIEALAGDPQVRLSMGRAARAYVQEHLDVSIAWRDIHALIEEAANRR